MPSHRTSSGDPARTLGLLWREEAATLTRRGPRPRLSVTDVVKAAIAFADDEGLDALTIRGLAERLGVSPMTLYTYVPGKAELLDLMLDVVYADMPRPVWTRHQRWRARLRRIADANRALFEAHPWAARVSTSRPPLGPGLLAKYEHELGALEGLGLGDVQMDACLTFLLGFVQAWAVSAQDATAAPESDAEWWAQAGPLLERVLDPARFPLASRVGSAAGAAQGAAYAPEHAYAFGVERAIDGLGALVDAPTQAPRVRLSAPPPRPPARPGRSG